MIVSHGLVLTDLERESHIDVTIDGCDEADLDLTLIKGGGGCQTQEKIVAQYSEDFVVIADYRKKSDKLGESWDYVPIEVVPMAYKQIQNNIVNKLGGKVELRKVFTIFCSECGFRNNTFSGWPKTRQVQW